MTRPRRDASARLLGWVVCGACLLWSLAGAEGRAPYRVALDVHWGGGAGSDAFRDDLSRSLAEVLVTRCFEGVSNAVGDSATADRELLLTVVLSDVVEETRFDDSIAGALQPGEPSKELRRVARFQVTADATLSARASGAVVRQKHLVVNVYRRPIYVGEDPQAGARTEAVDRIVSDLARALGCGRAKLERKIDDVLGAPGGSTPQPR